MQVAISWNQTAKTYNKTTTATTDDTVVFNITGYTLLGFEIVGVPFGAKINGSWQGASLQLTP
ncbi:hypothetical protein [Paenibacillus glacialis]|nr:hypothetical protein [Paenibacillus glacialis]